jgi:hypothetical protein
VRLVITAKLKDPGSIPIALHWKVTSVPGKTVVSSGGSRSSSPGARVEVGASPVGDGADAGVVVGGSIVTRAVGSGACTVGVAVPLPKPTIGAR